MRVKVLSALRNQIIIIKNYWGNCSRILLAARLFHIIQIASRHALFILIIIYMITLYLQFSFSYINFLLLHIFHDCIKKNHKSVLICHAKRFVFFLFCKKIKYRERARVGGGVEKCNKIEGEKTKLI